MKTSSVSHEELLLYTVQSLYSRLYSVQSLYRTVQDCTVDRTVVRSSVQCTVAVQDGTGLYSRPYSYTVDCTLCTVDCTQLGHVLVTCLVIAWSRAWSHAWSRAWSRVGNFLVTCKVTCLATAWSRAWSLIGHV